MKGILLAGGSGTRLYPATVVTSKQLQILYDKPIVYYPLATLLGIGITDILLISTPQDIGGFERLLGDGSRFGASIQYQVQQRPEGIAQAYMIGERFIDGAHSCLILGDNLFHGDTSLFVQAGASNPGATIFGYPVSDPRAYGVVEIAQDGTVLSLEEKPAVPKSDLAVPGIYFFDGTAPERTAMLTPSARNELEIISLISSYWRDGRLRAVPIEDEFTWLDTGTPAAIVQAANYLSTLEERRRVKVGCPEEAAYRCGVLDDAGLERAITQTPKSPYREYLERVLRKGRRHSVPQ